MSSSSRNHQVNFQIQRGACTFNTALSGCLAIALLMLPTIDVAIAAGPTPETLDQTNQLLQGKVAFIDLADGRTITKAKKVVMEANFTYWQSKGDDQKVETEQVLRIRARTKSRGLIGLGAGAATGALLALASNTGETSCNEIGQCTSDATSEQLGFLVAVGAGAGFGVGKAMPNKQKVVYQAQDTSESEPSGSSFD